MNTRTVGLLRTASMALLAACLAYTGVHAEQLLSAHYEVNITDQGSTNTVRSSFRLKPGESERLELHPNTVKLSVQPVSEREYELQIVVVPTKQPASAARLNQKFKGTFGIPLELSAKAGSLQVDGAISVTVLESR